MTSQEAYKWRTHGTNDVGKTENVAHPKPHNPSNGSHAMTTPSHRRPHEAGNGLPVSESAGRCVFRGTIDDGNNGNIVIPATHMGPKAPWKKNGEKSVTWKPDGGRGIDKPGPEAMCVRVQFPLDGFYYMTARSSAPHGTEHNDAWFKFSGGFMLYRPKSNTWKYGHNNYYKGYQNNGNNEITDYVVTVDHHGHQFVTRRVSAKNIYSVCLAGRSSKYTVYEVIFVLCDGGRGCSRASNGIRKSMTSLHYSRCL